ncbi:hypothetical protein [Planomicrobium sp. CPCC 101079]|uniref:hypothetical protein n=1 Tax=Planomicrobium sp. CPCC 101079 TaxID=2599618 RepID=UPI0011B63014|nr:hypothetical protein [Planomicrobium sp. CPCC 101079]TWT01566.1 hypothetical protein FQV28_15965 [Planomicrobium sp. CPCC 101079]
MSQHESSTQETNIEKMNELVEEKNKETSEKQHSDPQAQRNQSLQDQAHTPDENNKLTNRNNNRTP